jgi:RNA-directed DNA polymerase
VERYRDLGLRSVFRADIANFFDEIDHDLLQARVAGVVGDALVTELVMGLVAAPLVTPNGLVERRAGVPQGAPVSPALANHFLARFDRATDGRRGRLVRYADDLGVLCADDEGAQVARWDVEQALGGLRLRINEAKSYVSNFDRGISFLGWVFFRTGGYEESPSPRWVHPMAVGRSQAGQGRRPW